jgi:predicted phage baseplate assembly protein
MVTLQLSRSPQPTVLFGEQRQWLRVRPRAGFAGENWRPVIRSIYANAAWAVAAETQTRERLASSDGSPNQHATLARPPILEGTLKLRVREPIGRDDAEALKEAGIAVSDGLGPWAGSWVLWKEVPDPDDHGPNDRVYALDSETGDISFGDGRHGMVPPAGRDSIVAEQYQRGGGAAANNVTAWSEMSLVTPLRGVEGVIVPEGGAGGSDPQNPETTVRFAPANLQLRDRALTLRDIEQLALQSSAKVAQARAIGRGLGAKVIVVARGLDPRPSSADRRAVRRYLLRRSPPAWALRGAIDVVPPRLVPIKVLVALTIDTIDVSGDVAKAAADAIKLLLDAELGGAGDGWPLGELLTDAEVAARLVELAHVEEVNRIRLQAVSPDGKLTTLAPPAADQLLQLAADGVQVDLAVAESEVGA